MQAGIGGLAPGIASLPDAAARVVVVGARPKFDWSIHSSGRYGVDSLGVPLFPFFDTAWSAFVQFDDAGCDLYLDNRAAKGFGGTLVNLIERGFSSQSPRLLNVDGVAPFVNMADFSSGLVPGYWNRAVRFVAKARDLNMLVVATPAYIGYAGSDEGWDDEISPQSNAQLFNYGAQLGALFLPFRNIIWNKGGDAAPGALKAQLEQIHSGILSVDPGARFMAHPEPGASGATDWSDTPGYLIHTGYPGDVLAVAPSVLAEWNRSPVRPVCMIEALYEFERASPLDRDGMCRQTHHAVLCGAWAVMFGNNPIWHGKASNEPWPSTGSWQSNLDSNGSQDMARMISFYNGFPREKLVPIQDSTGLITTALGSGATRITGAIANDGTFALVYVDASQTVNFNLNTLTGITSNVRVRRFTATTGAIDAVNTYAKSSSQNVPSGGRGVLILDQG